MKATTREREISINWSSDLFLIPFIDQTIDLFIILSLLQNTSSDMNHTTDGFINSIFNDEDLHLMDMTDSKC